MLLFTKEQLISWGENFWRDSKPKAPILLKFELITWGYGDDILTWFKLKKLQSEINTKRLQSEIFECIYWSILESPGPVKLQLIIEVFPDIMRLTWLVKLQSIILQLSKFQS